MKYSLSSVTDCEIIFSHDDAVILSGNNPWLFRRDGTFIAKYKTIRNAYKMVFLPGKRVLINGAVDCAYHYISLDNGEILWSIPQKGRRSSPLCEFAGSPDGSIVYCIYEVRQILHIDQIIISEKRMVTYSLALDQLQATTHCYCDSSGKLALLQSFQVKEGQRPYLFCGILKWKSDISPFWTHQWKSDLDFRSIPCICNDEYVLRNDLTVLSLKDGSVIDLLEHTPGLRIAPGVINVCHYDAERGLLTVRFSRSWSTVIIDCKKREVVAHYRVLSKGLSGGCLIGNEFWVGTYDGIVKRPFPHIDEYPRLL